jgi:uncharacterized membrane protein YcjF (UPF0283 family)
MLQSLFYLTFALHVLGVTITHLQEHKTTVTTASGNRYIVLLSAAIVEELELVILNLWVKKVWLEILRTEPQFVEVLACNVVIVRYARSLYLC